MIPINPSIVQGAPLYPRNFSASELSLFDTMGQKESFIPMQFLFATSSVWKVDLRMGNPQSPLSKISNIYVDALNAANDVMIYFPDTGFMVHVGAGTCFMCPPLVSRDTFVFYVFLKNQVLSATDQVNLFVMNIATPYFDTLWQYKNGLNGNKSNWFYVGKGSAPPPSATNFYNLSNYGGNNSWGLSYINSFQIGMGVQSFDSSPITIGLWYADTNNFDYTQPIWTHAVSGTNGSYVDYNFSVSNINWTSPNTPDYVVWLTVAASGSVFTNPTLPRLLILA